MSVASKFLDETRPCFSYIKAWEEQNNFLIFIGKSAISQFIVCMFHLELFKLLAKLQEVMLQLYLVLQIYVVAKEILF